MTLAELREARAKAAADLKELAALLNTEEGQEPREFTAEQRSKFEALETKIKELSTKIAAAEGTEDIQRRAADVDRYLESRRPHPLATRTDPEPEPGDHERLAALSRDRSLAFRGWCRGGMPGGATSEQRAAADRLRVDIASEHFTMPLQSRGEVEQIQHRFREMHPMLARQSRAMSALAAGTGGVFVPASFRQRIEENRLYYGGVERVATPIRTATGDTLSYPTVDDTANEGDIVGENADHGTASDPSTGTIDFHAYPFGSGVLPVPNSLIQDSVFDLDAMIASWLMKRIGRKKNTYFTTGSGGGQPRGIVTGATLGVTAADTANIDPDEVIDLIHSVDPEYREQPGAGFMGADSIIKHLRKIKDGNGNYMWQDGMRTGTPNTLYGYPFTINTAMAAIAASAKVLLFGDLAQYHVRTVAGMVLRRLVERYAEKDQTGFMAIERADGNLIDAGTAPVCYLQMAAS